MKYTVRLLGIRREIDVRKGISREGLIQHPVVTNTEVRVRIYPETIPESPIGFMRGTPLGRMKIENEDYEERAVYLTRNEHDRLGKLIEDIEARMQRQIEDEQPRPWGEFFGKPPQE